VNRSLFQEKNQWHTGLAQDLRRLRRPVDKFIYEPVFVGTYEDAVLATILNGSVEAVIIYEGIPLTSCHDATVLREFLATKSTVVLLTLFGRTQDTTAAAKSLGVADRPTDVADVAFIGGAITLGALVGALVLKIHGVPLTLSPAGGALIAGLVFGWREVA
jgi:hypothetical protein